MNSLVKLNTMADTSDSESLQVPAPVAVTYDKLLIQQDETIHAIIQDILSCTIEDIKRTKTVDMMEVLENFSGSSPHKKKAELLDFLRIMPEYKTTDKDTMALRLKALKKELHRRGEIEDLLIWAKLKYAKKPDNE